MWESELVTSWTFLSSLLSTADVVELNTIQSTNATKRFSRRFHPDYRGTWRLPFNVTVPLRIKPRAQRCLIRTENRRYPWRTANYWAARTRLRTTSSTKWDQRVIPVSSLETGYVKKKRKKKSRDFIRKEVWIFWGKSEYCSHANILQLIGFPLFPFALHKLFFICLKMYPPIL